MQYFMINHNFIVYWLTVRWEKFTVKMTLQLSSQVLIFYTVMIIITPCARVQMGSSNNTSK